MKRFKALWRLVKTFGLIGRRLWIICCRYALFAACGATSFAVASLGLTYPALACPILAYAAYKRLRKWRGSGWAYGTARISTFLDLCRAGFLSNHDGLIIGRASFTTRPSRLQALRLLLNPFTGSPVALRMLFAAFFNVGGNSLIRIHNYVNLAVFGSTGSGKGVGIIIPILRSYIGNCICTDPKGENFRLSADIRRRMGDTILRLDPFHVAGEGSDSLNPLDLIDEFAADFPEQAAQLADALVVTTGNEKEPHFPESAKLILKSIIMWVCVMESEPEYRSLQRVRYILQSRNRFNDTMIAMQECTLLDGLISGMGHMLTFYVDKELGSVLTTISRYTSWLDSTAMRAITTQSTFDPRKFRSCPATLYLVLPPEKLKILAPLMRMWISTMLQSAAMGGADESKPVLYLLDEVGHLGHMQILEDAVTLMRGYGVRLFFFYQSIGQVSEAYGDRASRFLDNIGTQLFMGVNAYESAEAISKRCGDATILIQSLNESKSFSRPTGGYSKDTPKGNISTSRSINYQEMGRALYRPDEILRLSDEVGLLFHRNMFLTPIKLLRFYQEKEFRKNRTAAYRDGIGLRAGLVAVSALLGSLGLLAVAIHLPVATIRSPFQAQPEAFFPEGFFDQAGPPASGPVGPRQPNRSLRPAFPPPGYTPSPDRFGDELGMRRRATRRGYR